MQEPNSLDRVSVFITSPLQVCSCIAAGLPVRVAQQLRGIPINIYLVGTYDADKIHTWPGTSHSTTPLADAWRNRLASAN